MNRYLFLSSFVSGSLMLIPVTALAGGTQDSAVTPSSDSITTEDVLNAISAPAMPADGMGGGGMSAMPYYGGGVMIDTSITKSVTPDFIAINAYCDLGVQPTRAAAKSEADGIFNSIKSAVGTDGKVRRSGGVSVYPYYDQTGVPTTSFSANISLFIRVTKASAAQRISDAVENAGCTVSWDVRLLDTQSFETSVLDDLITRLNKRKSMFEKLLGKKLSVINSVSINTWVDGYSSYDAQSNTADATTTLSISYDLGGRTTIRTPQTFNNAQPKG